MATNSPPESLEERVLIVVRDQTTFGMVNEVTAQPIQPLSPDLLASRIDIGTTGM
jgi:hypothetical protein